MLFIDSFCSYRLYQPAIFQGFKRGQRRLHTQQALLKIKDANEVKGARYYLGKRVAYIHKEKTTKRNSRYRVAWGKVIGLHGVNGVVRAKFAKNLPPRAIGARLRVMLYPQRA